MPYRRLEKHVLQHLAAHETEKIKICKTLQLGRQIKICSGIHQKDSWIHKICLAFFFAAAQAGQQTSIRSQCNTGTSQPYCLPIPKAKKSAGKIRQIDN